MNVTIRKSCIKDLPFWKQLESEAFLPYQRTQLQNIKHSIQSDFQEVLVAEIKGVSKQMPVGGLILFKYPKTLRLYSIAIFPKHQRKGFGDALMKHVFNLANLYHYERIILEVSTENPTLIDWYKAWGFKEQAYKPDYYCQGKHALKMEYRINDRQTSNIIVINRPEHWTDIPMNAKVITVKEYIHNPAFHTNTNLRIFNLCSSYKYQSYGYYVSLLASARGQRVIPSSVTLRDFRILNVIRSAANDIDELINQSLAKVKPDHFSLTVYFGFTHQKGFKTLAQKLHQLYEAPLFKIDFVRHDNWLIKNIQVITFNKVSYDERPFLYECASKYFSKKRFNATRLTNYKYDLAILVNHSEKTPPSCPLALKKFKKAANRKGIYVEFITKSDIDKINEFDALFIRETTGVDNHTYELARLAYAEGLVVVDDPWSILKCSNKIYQNEVFKKNKIRTPQTRLFTKNLFVKKSLDQLSFPLVLKQPDSSFSLGITKVENKDEALEQLLLLFKKSDMVIGQEFLYSEFDWRIGVMDNQALFACKYYMSIGHWQIYNWKEGADQNAGDSETVSIDQVPEQVIKTALKAAALIGDGLYGVDLKVVGDEVYVIEVNDNPNIDAGIEDLELKDKLYALIIDSIYNRIEVAKNLRQIDFRKS
jgi:glutathione synthase/RimK-type ligase-like ATP-grasp enzyme/ribosomal protein S18 acetylase RimI-like enzyme